MKVKIKKTNELAVIPKYAKDGDAGLDLIATSKEIDSLGNIVYGTGIAVEIPKGYVGLIFPRSSVSKYSLSLSNAVGVIDSGYRGEISCKFKEATQIGEKVQYNVGDKICQLIIMPYPEIEFEEVSELSDSERGEKGFGSTGS